MHAHMHTHVRLYTVFQVYMEYILDCFFTGWMPFSYQLTRPPKNFVKI